MTILKASGLENARVQSVNGHKSDSAIESYHKCPTLEQQVQSSAIVRLDFVAGSSQCQAGRKRALMEIQKTTTWRSPDFKCRPLRLLHRSPTQHSVIPSGQSFSAGQFHHCISNIKYWSNWTWDEMTTGLQSAGCFVHAGHYVYTRFTESDALILFNLVLARKS